MIAHLVLFRLDPGVARDDARVARFVTAMGELPAQIPFIRGWQHGYNDTADALAWDYGLRALFDNREDLAAYFDHPAHLPVVALWRGIGSVAFCDFEVSA